MRLYRIILADDHEVLRQRISQMINTSDDLKVVGEAGDGLTLLELVKMAVPDMAILDISMPNLPGVEATRRIKTIYPQVKILILSMHKDKQYLYHAFCAGANGYLLKEDTDTELFCAIKTVREGGVYISPLIAKELTRNFVGI